MDKYYQEYRDVKKLEPFSLRRVARNIALNGLSLADSIKSNFKNLSKPRVQFLYIHHVFNDEERKLDWLLGELNKQHTFISYSEAVKRVLTSAIDKPYITISSDDGFKNNLNALKILASYEAKACFFINPGITGEQDFEKIKVYCKVKLNFPPVEFLNWKDIERILVEGHEIGSHTMSHANLAKSAPEQAEEEINKSYEEIKKYCGQADHFAYPYGSFIDFNLFTKNKVFEAGFISCASAVRGCHIGNGSELKVSELCIRRDHIILDWQLKHIMHFLIHNSMTSSALNNYFPLSFK